MHLQSSHEGGVGGEIQSSTERAMYLMTYFPEESFLLIL